MTQGLAEGFVRQRRALVATSVALSAFVGLGARLDNIEFLGNTLTLAAPLSVATPLWIAWGYFLIRYYQYFRDLGDTGFREARTIRENTLARNFALARLRESIHPEPGEFRHPRIRVEVGPMDVVDMPPGMWRLKANGWAHITERFGSKTNRMSSQLIENQIVSFPPWQPRFARLRSVIWVLTHTRFGTEYGLPFLVALAPWAVVVARRLGFVWPAA